MPATVHVERLDPAEWRVWRALRLEALAEDPDAFSETLTESRARDDAHWIERTGDTAEWNRIVLLATVDGRPAGIGVALIAPATPAVANLYAMWVQPAARRSGVGRALVDAAVAWAAAQAAREVRLCVTETNHAARALYAAMGFVDVGDDGPLRPGSSLRTRGMVRTLR